MSAPWESVVDAQMDIWKWWGSDYGHEVQGRLAACGLERQDVPWFADSADLARRTAHEGEPVWISKNVVHLVIHAASTFRPEPLLPSDLYVPCGFSILEEPFVMEPPTVTDEDLQGFSDIERAAITGRPVLRAIGWFPIEEPDDHRRGVFISGYSRPGLDGCLADGTPMTEAGMVARSGTTWKPEVLYPFVFGDSSHLQQRLFRRLQCLWRFLLQTITVVSAQSPSRHVRRRIDRAGWEARAINVVMLRRREYKQDDSGDCSRDYECRWLVNGHWRNQWFPSQEAHRQIWIDPYVKGPDDKPFKPASRRVLMAVR